MRWPGSLWVWSGLSHDVAHTDHRHGVLVFSPDPHAGPREPGEMLPLQSVPCLGAEVQKDPEVTQRCLPPPLSHGPRGVCSQSSFLCHRNLSAIQDREICCYSISCKEKDNIGAYWWLRCGAQGAAVGGQVGSPRSGVGDSQGERL